MGDVLGGCMRAAELLRVPIGLFVISGVDQVAQKVVLARWPGTVVWPSAVDVFPVDWYLNFREGLMMARQGPALDRWSARCKRASGLPPGMC